MKHGFASKVLTLCVAIALLLAVAVPAMADVVTTNTAAEVTKDVTFVKRLTMDSEDIITPKVTFTFQVTAPSSDIAADPQKGTPYIFKGIIKAGKPSVQEAEFTSADTHVGKNYVEKTLKVDFTGIKFEHPGVYRYTIFENPSSVAGVDDDPTDTRYLDVYVEDKAGDGVLTVLGYVLHTNYEGAIGDAPTEAKPNANKDGGFFNTYTTQKVTLSKKVTGNQGDRAKLFQFQIDISNVPEGSKFNVTGTTGNAAPTDPAGLPASTGSTITVADTATTVTAYYYLRSDESISILGLPAGAKYTIQEVLSVNEGYTTTLKKDNATANLSTDRKTDEQTVADADASFEFTNDRTGTVPTGIMMDVAPFALLVILAGVALMMLTRKRKAAQN